MSGKILLIGFGPGAEQHMSFRAKNAIAEADIVIGYTTYIKLVKELLVGKEVIKKGMTEEIDRCVEAYQQAKNGKTVALISSGDVGVYGMAGPTYEVLLQSGWTPNDAIKVEIVPGSTALSACASLVGAPLTHDFCAISLSDLLTPWTVIARRLEAAAQADFVVALYNPKSGRRTQQIVQAQAILLRYREPSTPVAIVKSAYRRRQTIQLVRLDEMADCDIGMLTTVLIGNSSTYIKHELMITPRGYANKYDNLIGAAKTGEQAGRSLSMGLDGWQACLRRYLNQQTTLSWEQTADYFGVAVAEVLAAVALGSEDNTPCTAHTAYKVHPEKLQLAIQASAHWGRLRGVVRTATGAVVELFLQANDFTQRADWLTIENDSFHLHINWKQVHAAYFAWRANKSYGLHFVDGHGNLVFRLLLTKQQGAFNATQLATYQQDCQTLSSSEQGYNND